MRVIPAATMFGPVSGISSFLLNATEAAQPSSGGRILGGFSRRPSDFKSATRRICTDPGRLG
jgi:hypothetical protein